MGRAISRAAALSVIVFGALLASCANLTVQKLSDNEELPNAPVQGKLTYFLPRTSISVALTVQITECGSLSTDPIPDADATSEEQPQPRRIKLKISMVATPALEADPNYQYAVDYDAAESWLKEINFTVNTTPNKVLQSFNGTINDQSGPILLGALTAAVQIAGAVSIPGVGGLHQADQTVKGPGTLGFTPDAFTGDQPKHGDHAETVPPLLDAKV
jgi:hypothetical protein